MEASFDLEYMRLALVEAEQAAKEGEVPVGAVIVCRGEILAQTHNRCEQDHCATAHAELLAIEEACRKIGSWRLQDCTLYVTLEPCPMCMGAAINSRLAQIVYGARDPRMGACGSLLDLTRYPLEVRPQVIRDVLEEESLFLLRRFFAEKRKNKK